MARSEVVLITGASAGIGAYVAREYAKRGAKLVLTARRLERLTDLVKECEGLHEDCQALAVRADVTNDKEIELAVVKGVKKFGKIDCVIANAGFAVIGKVENLALDDFRRQFETNVFGVLRTFYASLPELKKHKGRFAVVGSVNSYVTLPTVAPYCMSKFAIRALTESLYYELQPHGISTTLICPGFVESEIRQVDNSGKFHSSAEDAIPEWIRMPTDVAARKIVKAVEARKRELVFTGHGKLFVALRQKTPSVWNALLVPFSKKLKDNAETNPRRRSARADS